MDQEILRLITDCKFLAIHQESFSVYPEKFDSQISDIKFLKLDPETLLFKIGKFPVWDYWSVFGLDFQTHNPKSFYRLLSLPPTYAYVSLSTENQVKIFLLLKMAKGLEMHQKNHYTAQAWVSYVLVLIRDVIEVITKSLLYNRIKCFSLEKNICSKWICLRPQPWPQTSF